MSAAYSRASPGAKAFFTPCLFLAASMATLLKQLGLPMGGFSLAIALYLTLDFLSFRLGPRVPILRELRRPFGAPSVTPPVAVGTGSTDNGAKAKRSSSAASAVERRAQPAAGTAVRASAPIAASTAAAKSEGLRLSMRGKDIYANAETPFEFENDFFKGRMLFLLKSNPPDPKFGAHFEGKNRTFEMQIQGKLKLLPQGEVYMGGELDERPKQGLVTQTVSKIVMSFAKQLVKSLHYSFGEKRALPDPLDAESAHVTFPLYRVMDWFVVTPEAEVPPRLGGDLAEAAEDKAARRSGKSPDIVWSTDVTYTMCFHSNTVDFQEWAVINVPGQGSLDLNTFLCKQPVSVVVYDFTAPNASAAHKARDKSYMFRCTISNDNPGSVARPVAAPSVLPAADSPRPTAAMRLETPDGYESDDVGMSGYREGREGTAVGIGSSDEHTDHDGRVSTSPVLSLDGAGGLSIPSAASSPRKAFHVPAFHAPDDKGGNSKGLVKSGDVLPLIMGEKDFPPSLQDASHDQATSVAVLGEGHGGGVAMLRGNAMLTGIQVVKVGGGSGSFRSDYLYEGDVIVLLHPGSRKFMRIGRGWALGWSSKASASKIHFAIKGLPGGRPLAHGQAFSLSSRRWSDWEVGVARQSSNKVGGRALGCFNRGKRRNTTRLSLLTLVARPWFDPAADLEEGEAGGVIPALEAEADAITISLRGPFEDVASEEDDEEEEEEEEGEEGSDNARSEVDDAMSESDPEYYSDVDRTDMDRGVRSQPSFSGDGISAKASRAMACYPDNVSSLQVNVPAWVEFLHRGRRQGQLAFIVAVHAAPLPSSTAPPPNVTNLSTDGTGGAETGSDSAASPSRIAPPPAWTCLRTGRELSGVVQAYRESIGASTAAGVWRSKPRPRLIRHMGTAGQSVRLIRHEVSEMQRWEASIRSRDRGHNSPSTVESASSPLMQNHGSPLSSTKPEDAASSSLGVGSHLEPAAPTSQEGTLSPGDGDGPSPPQAQRSPRPLTGRRVVSECLSPSGPAKRISEGTVSTPEGTQSSTTGDGSPVGRSAAGRKGAGGEGVTAPYRMLCEAVSSPGELDRHFLSGLTASDLGVTVGTSAGTPVLGSPVARCLWESHWREEWAALFASHVACYSPLSKKPAWVLPLKNLHKVSAVSDERCPFPGLRCLRLETIGRVHYLCFASRCSRDDWLGEVSRLWKSGVADLPSVLELDQDPRETYVLKTTQWRMPPRLVLNARRPGFDLSDSMYKQGNRAEEGGAGAGSRDQQRHPLWQLSAEVLRSAFKVSADPGNKGLVPFLDLASTFRSVDLSSLDLDSDEALCFFANLYHLVVRHMLLVLGPPSSSKEWPSSYAQVSYEVGGDVFSLQELEHCVLRGRLSRPSLKDLPKRFAPLPPEGDDHYVYSLGKADGRMGLFLNNGSQSNPSVVVLLSPEMVDEQLNRACQLFVDHTVKTDLKRRQILVHKYFQLYARDLQPRATSKDMIRYGLRFAGRAVIHALSALDVDISQAHIRYHPYLLKCHETMTLLDVPVPVDDAASPPQRGN